MLKKSIFLIIAFLVVGLTVVQAQNMARLEQLERELEQLEAKVDRGQQLTPREVQRMQEIQQEVMRELQNSQYGGLIQQYQPPQGNQAQQQQQLQQIEQMQQQMQQWQQMTAPQPQQPQQQGANAGWPPASAFQGRFKISPLRQPAGTTARYDSYEERGVVNSLEIFISGGNANTVMQDLKRQIEAITGRQMNQEDGNNYFGFIQDPNYGSNSENHIRFWLYLENNTVTLRINPVAQ